MNNDSGETVGWPEYVAQIGAAYRNLPPDQRSSTAVVASNYGEAGAVDRYGRESGLPPAFSVHNGFWYWGPPPAAAVHALAIGFSAGDIDRFCSDPVLTTRLHNRWSVKNQEEGAPVWSCATLRGTWIELWPRMKVIG